MESLNGNGVRDILAVMADLMAEKKDEIGELDGVIGDGDLGLTMSKGFRAVSDALMTLEETDVGSLLGKAGMTMARAAPSTMGTLMGTLLMRMGKASQGKIEVSLADLGVMFTDGVEGLMARGKSKAGDKTLIDVLDPAARALRDGAVAGLDLATGVGQAYQAAQEGLLATKGMISQHGKAACFQEKTLGKVDPGAAVGVYLMSAFARVCAG